MAGWDWLGAAADTRLIAESAHLASPEGRDGSVSVIPMRDQDGQEPPPPVARAMSEAAVIFSPVRIRVSGDLRNGNPSTHSTEDWTGD